MLNDHERIARDEEFVHDGEEILDVIEAQASVQACGHTNVRP